MRSFCATILIIVLLAGCSAKNLQSVGGNYYYETIDHRSLMAEPGGFDIRLIVNNSGNRVLVSEFPCSSGAKTYNDFSTRIYGDNLAFVEQVESRSGGRRLVVYSAKRGNTVIVPNLDDFWKVDADERGISCHRYENGNEKEDPNPAFFSADYLKQQ